MIRQFAITMCAAAGVALTAGSAQAMEPATLVTAELERQSIQFVSLRDGRLSYFDSERRLGSADVADYVSLQFGGGESAPAERDAAEGRLLLADGHELPGRLAGVDDAGRLVWRHEVLGAVPVELDDVLVLLVGTGTEEPASEASEEETEAEAPDEAAAEVEEPDNGAAVTDREVIEADMDPLDLVVDGPDDRVVLRNGDVLEGFVESVESDALQLQVGGRTLPLAWERVAAVALANPVSEAAGQWLTLRDGSRLRVEELAIDSEGVSGQVFSGQAIEISSDAVAGVQFAGRHRLTTLVELEPRVVAGGVVFGVSMEPVFGREVSKLHAPVTVAVELPEGARRFAAEAAIEKDALAWADLEIIIEDAEGERFRAHLNADKPGVSINVPVTGGRLVIELDEAANGPVMDRLRLHNAAVLLER